MATNYVIKRSYDGAYVAQLPHGATRGGSYTRKLQHARLFGSREQAEREVCGNEVVVEVAAELGGVRS